MKRVIVMLAAAAFVAGCEGSDVTRVRNSEEVVVRGHKLSLHGVDGPNLQAECAPEKQAAAQAEARIAELLASGVVEYRKTGMVCLQFMMCDAFVTVNGVDVGETLIAEGHAVKAAPEGSREPPFDWCRPEPLVGEQAGPEESLDVPPPPSSGAQPNTEDTLQSPPPVAPIAPPLPDQPVPPDQPAPPIEPVPPQD